MLKRAGMRVFSFAGLMVCGLLFPPSGFAQTALPPQVSQTFTRTGIPLGGTTVLTITLTNPNTDVTLNNISFDDVLPLGLERPPLDGFDSCGGNFSSIPTGGEMLLSNITLGPSGSCTMTTTLTGGSLGTKTNSFAAQTPTEGFGNTSTATVNVLVPPTISEVFNPFIIPLRTGGAIPPISTVTFTLTNPNSVGDFTGLGFSDSLTGLAVATTPAVTNTCGGNWVPAAGDTVLNLTGGNLNASQSCTVSVNVTGTQPGQHNNQASAPFSIEGGTGVPGNIAPMAVASPPGIFMSLEPFALPPTSVPLNQPFGLFLQVDDPNPTIGLSGIGFTDTFPAGLVLTGTGPGQCSPGVTFTGTLSGNTISISNLNFNGTQNCQFSLNMVGTTPGPKTNTIPAATSNEGGTGGPYSVTIDIVAPPTVGKASIHETAWRHGIESQRRDVSVGHEISVDVQDQVRIVGGKEAHSSVCACRQDAGHRFVPAIRVEVGCERLRLPAREGRKKSEDAMRDNCDIQRIRLRVIWYSAGTAGNV